MAAHPAFSSRLRSALRRLWSFVYAQEGSVSVEFIVWIPVLLLILAFTADACMLYLTQADIWNVARDSARRMSILQLTASPDTVTPFVKGQLLYYNANYTITPSVQTSCASHVQTINDVLLISVPVKYASVFGILEVYGSFTDATLSAQVTMLEEDSGGSC